MRTKTFMSVFTILFLLVGIAITNSILAMPGTAAQDSVADLTRSDIIKIAALAPGSGLKLRGVNLPNINLEELDLSYANLSVANFKGAKLHNLVLIGVMLSNVDFSDADLSAVILDNANLDWSNLGSVDILA